MDHATATIARHGHVMPPGRSPVSRWGQNQATARGGTQDVGGMLIGDDNRLYGAAFPGSPLEVARIRPHSATPAFRPLSGSTPGHHQGNIAAHANVNTANGGAINNRSKNPASQLNRAISTPRDRGVPGGGAGGAAAARSVSANRSGGTGTVVVAAAPTAATAGAAAPAPATHRSSRTTAQRITSSLGMSLLDRSLPAVRAAAALEEELLATRTKLTEAREEQRKAVASVRKLEVEVQEERAARVRLEDQLAAARKGRISSAWADANAAAARSSERHTYNGKGSITAAVAAAAAAATGAVDWDGKDGGGGGTAANSGGGPRVRPASASAATSHLVASLRWEIRQLTATRDALAGQLAEIKATSRVQRLQELQTELERYREEVGRQMGLVKLMSSRLDAAEAEAAEARAALQNKQAQLAEAEASAAVPLSLPIENNLSRNTVRSALVVLQKAHKLIMAEARLLKSAFPPMISLPELRELALLRPNTAGAGEALMFLTSHLARLMGEVRGLPGVPSLRGPPTAAEAREAAANTAAALSGGGGGVPRPSGSGALDLDSHVAALAKMGTISSIKAARAAAATRADVIVAAAKAAAGSGTAAAAAARHERLGGRLSPGKTVRPNSARTTRGSPVAAADASARLGRGVLLTPGAGNPAAAEQLKEKLSESVAVLAAEARERKLDTSEPTGDAVAASGQDSARSSRKGTAVYGSRTGSATGEAPATAASSVDAHLAAAEVEAEAEGYVEADVAPPLPDLEDLPQQQSVAMGFAPTEGEEEAAGGHQETQAVAVDGGADAAYDGYGDAGEEGGAAAEHLTEEAVAAAAAEGGEEGYGYGYADEPPAGDGEAAPEMYDGGGELTGGGEGGDAAADGEAQGYGDGGDAYGTYDNAAEENQEAGGNFTAGYGDVDGDPYGEQSAGDEAANGGEVDYTAATGEGRGEGGDAAEWQAEDPDVNKPQPEEVDY